MGNISNFGLSVYFAESTYQPARTAVVVGPGSTFSPTLAESMAYHADQLEWSWNKDFVVNYRSLMQNRLNRMVADLNAALDTTLRRSMTDEVDDDPSSTGAQNSKAAPLGNLYGWHNATAKGAAMQQFETIRTQAVIEKAVPMTKGQILGIPLGPTIQASNYDPVRGGLAHRLVPAPSLLKTILQSGLSGGLSGAAGAVVNWLITPTDKTLAYDINDNDVGETIEVKVGTGGFWSTTNYLKMFKMDNVATSVDPTFSFMQAHTSESRNWYTGPFNSNVIGGGGPASFLKSRPALALRNRLGSWTLDYSVIPDKVPTIGGIPVYFFIATGVNYATIDVAGIPIPNPNALFGFPLNPVGLGAVASFLPAPIGTTLGGILGVARDGLYFGSDSTVFERFKNAPGYGGNGIGGLDPYILNNSINWWDDNTAMDHPPSPSGSVPFATGQLWNSNSSGSIGSTGPTSVDRSIYQNSLVVQTSTNRAAAPGGAAVAAAQAALNAAQAGLQSALNDLETATLAEQGAQATLNNTNAQIAALNQAVTDAQADLDAANAALDAAQNRLDDANTAVADAQARVDQAQDDLDTANQDVADKQVILDNAQPELDQANADLAAAQSAQTTATNDYNQAVADRQAACAGGPSPACTLATQEEADALAAKNQADADVAAAEQTVAEKQAQLDGAQENLDNAILNQQVAQDNYDQAVADLQEAQDREAQEIADAEAAVDAAEAQVTAAQTALTTATNNRDSQLPGLQAQAASNQTALNNATAAKNAAQTAVNNAQAAVDAAQAALQSAQAAAGLALNPQHYDLWGTVDESKGIDPNTLMDFGISNTDFSDHSKDYTSTDIKANPDTYMLLNDTTNTPKNQWGTGGLSNSGRKDTPLPVYAARIHQADGQTDTVERLKNLVSQSYGIQYRVNNVDIGITPTSFYNGTSSVSVGTPVGGMTASQLTVLDNDIDNYQKFQDRQNAKGQARLNPTFGNVSLGKFRGIDITPDRSNMLRDVLAKHISDPLNQGIFMLGMAKDIFITASTNTPQGDTLASSIMLQFKQTGTANSHTNASSAVALLQGNNEDNPYVNWALGLDGVSRPTLGVELRQERYTSFQSPR